MESNYFPTSFYKYFCVCFPPLPCEAGRVMIINIVWEPLPSQGNIPLTQNILAKSTVQYSTVQSTVLLPGLVLLNVWVFSACLYIWIIEDSGILRYILYPPYR